MLVQPLSASHKAALARATSGYHEQLMASPEAIAYLASRGISRETAVDFQLGFVVEPIEDEHRRFRGMHCIPNLGAAHDQHVVGLKFRDPRPDADKKYDQPTGQVPRLFNLRAMRQARDIIWVTEGEYDSVILCQAGMPSVAIPGANSFGTGGGYRHKIFDGYRVVLARDNDDAGALLAKAMNDLPELTVRIPPAPSKDVNDLWMKLTTDLSVDAAARELRRAMSPTSP